MSRSMYSPRTQLQPGALSQGGCRGSSPSPTSTRLLWLELCCVRRGRVSAVLRAGLALAVTGGSRAASFRADEESAASFALAA